MKTLIIVESYWGAGHMNVTAEAARALSDAGHEVHIAASERSFELGQTFDFGPAQKIIFPNILKDEHNRYIIAPSGKLVSDDPHAVTATRLEILKSAHETHQFDRAIIEGWPFGINVFDHSFSAFADYLTAQKVPIDGLARDVLGYPEPRYNDPRFHDMTAVTLANLYFDNLYVTADPSVITITQSLHPDAAPHLSQRFTHHVGFFGAQSMPKKRRMAKAKRPVIIAGGGAYKGAVRAHMLQMVTALSVTLPNTALANNPLKVIIGTEATDDDLHELKSITANLPQTDILRSLPSDEFRQEVANSALLLHKGGRNIAIDALQAGISNIFTPMADAQNGAWNEASIRAAAYTAAGYAQTLTIDDFANPTKLAAAINHKPKTKKPALNGAQVMATRTIGKPHPKA